ncbi:MAG TPA: acyl-CoA dehydrogenase family protein [Actinomycetota bacterium]|nr:acyl-CoA dehydrogenase family protein [Actinomycetota bacterium]
MTPAPHPNWWLDDEPFRRAVAARTGPEELARAEPLLERMGALAPAFFAPRARVADRHRPALERYDARGRRVDRVVYHPAYEEMTRAAYGFGLVRPADERGPLPQVAKFALGYLFAQGEAGLYCPVCCTDGVVRVLERFAPELAGRFVPRLTATDPDALLQGAMFMTEKAGGSDLSRIETEARPEDGAWRLYGEKWFCSNVDAGLILTIARAPEGLTVFLLPAEVDGEPNRYRIERLKDKLGVASMPTGEVVYDGALAYPVGERGKGVRVAAELFNLSRIYNAVASVGGARRALREAMASTVERVAFGAPVARQPLAMQDLARLQVELEANVALVLETARFLDRVDAGGTEPERRMLRILTPISKLITARFAVRAASEAMELLGGNGYIEDFDTPRLLRDAQVLPIWEGSTNVLVLDAVRSMAREHTLDAILADARARIPANGELAASAKQVALALDRAEGEAPGVLGGDLASARVLVERLALAYRGALLLEAGERGTDRERHVARLWVDGYVVPGMEAAALDLSEGYEELLGLDGD